MGSVLGPPTGGVRGLPDRVTVLYQEANIVVDAEFADVQGQLEIVSITIACTKAYLIPDPDAEPVAITSQILRSVPVRELKAALFSEPKQFFDPLNVPRRTGRDRLSRSFLEGIAEMYKAAVANGQPPLPTIADAHKVARPTTAKYVRRAREEGLLKWPARAGVSGATADHSPISGAGKRQTSHAKRTAIAKKNRKD
jgi:hypothetical protein